MIHLVGIEEEIVFSLFISYSEYYSFYLIKPSDLFLNTLFGYKSTYFYLITTLLDCLFTDN